MTIQTLIETELAVSATGLVKTTSSASSASRKAS